MLGYEPRKLTAQDCTVLCNLAGMVVKQMQRDQLLLEKETSGQLLQRRNSRLNVKQPICRIRTCSSPVLHVVQMCLLGGALAQQYE